MHRIHRKTSLKKKDMSKSLSSLISNFAGRTAQEFNQRKNRKGAFREGRYHATAVETNHHPVSCLTYIDLNMVRAGAAAHPSEWPHCGYAEIQRPRQRYSITGYRASMDLLGLSSVEALQKSRTLWAEQTLAKGKQGREGKWTESVAVGSSTFVEAIKAKLGVRARGRRISGPNDESVLCEPQVSLDLTF